jgi:plasmid stabilization system protein ParE
MKRRLHVRWEAKRDITEAVSWYDDKQPGLGNRFDSELSHLLKRIEDHPLQFPMVEVGVRRGLLNVFPYAVYFKVTDEEIMVLTVLHQSRDSRVWKSRL